MEMNALTQQEVSQRLNGYCNLLVSIIIPTYNNRRWIASTIDSALAQSYSPCEVIVVDDGSTDETGNYLRKEYGDRIKYIYQMNSGPASARNAGIAASSGTFIQFLDSDDFLAPDKIERQMGVFMHDPACQVVCCDFSFATEKIDGEFEESPLAYKEKYNTANVFESLLDGNFIVIHSPLTRRDVFRDCGVFDESLASDEDYDLWLRIAGRGYHFCFVPEVLAFYRRRGKSVSSNLLKQSEGTLQALNKARNYRSRLTKQESVKLKLNLSREYGWTSRHYLNQGNYSGAVSALLKSIITNPGHGLIAAVNSLKWMANRQLNRRLLWRFRNK